MYHLKTRTHYVRNDLNPNYVKKKSEKIGFWKYSMAVYNMNWDTEIYE